MTFLSSFSRTAASAALLFPTWIALGACGPDHEDKYPDTTAFCHARAEAECNTEVIRACAVVDATHCVDRRQAACLAETPPGTTYDATHADACITSVASAYADAKLTAEENRATDTVCVRVFDGTGSASAACQIDQDCRVSIGLRCVRAGGSALGTCQIPERVQGGGSCTLPRQLCIEGFHCGTSQHCDINGRVGEPCSELLPCASSATCSATGSCVSKFSDGTPCVNDAECLHDLCARGTGASQGLCVTQMTLAPNEPFCIDAR
jgi:hypothetical protein